MTSSATDDEKQENEATLFRKEPIESRLQRRLFSEPYHGQPKTRLIIAFLAFTTLASAMVFIAVASFTQTITVYGQLSGKRGITRLKAHQAGIITSIHVQEGDQVSAGTVLFETSSDRPINPDHSLRKDVTNEVNIRLDATKSELEDQQSLHQLETNEVQAKIDWIRTDIEKQNLEMTSLVRAANLSEKLLDRADKAAEKHLISNDQLDARHLDLIDRKAKLLLAARELARSEHQLGLAQIEKDRSAHEGRMTQATLIQRASVTRQELSELVSRTSEVITAPHDGIVTSVTASQGQTTDATSTLSLLSHTGDATIAHLYVSGSAIVHISVGDTVVLEYESMDAKKYGRTNATIESIPQLPMTGSELSAIAGGLPRDEGSSPGELLFDVIAAPTDRGLTFGVGDKMTQRGVTVRAVLPIKTQKIYEWMVEPLRMANGRQRAREKR